MSAEPTTSFAASGEDAIARTIAVAPAGPGGFAFDDFYEIERTAREIVRGAYKRIALQFPDELLHDAVPVFRRLGVRIRALRARRGQEEEGREEEGVQERREEPQPQRAEEGEGESEDHEPELYVLADTSYGSCCVDEVAAQHAAADALVHYGHACMTLTSRLPVIYVFGRKPLDAEACVGALLRAYDAGRAEADAAEAQAIVLRHDVEYTHAADALVRALEAALKKTRAAPPAVLYERRGARARPALGEVPVGDSAQGDGEGDGAAQATIFHVGADSLGLAHLLMTHAGHEVYTYDPAVGGTEAVRASARTSRLLMRRYAAVQKARDADVVGILVGTLGVAAYLPLIAHLRQRLAQRHKKSYMVSVGKLAPAKLANFLEIECFVLVACPENSVVEDKEFLRPIVTPFELELALAREPAWTGRYVLDFGRLLGEAREREGGGEAEGAEVGKGEGGEGDGDEGKEGEDEDEDDERPAFSLVTGTYRHARRFGVRGEGVGVGEENEGGKDDGEKEKEEGALVRRSEGGAVVQVQSAAGAFLAGRTYRGLEVRPGADAPGVLEQGRSGIARGYQDDRAHQEFGAA